MKIEEGARTCFPAARCLLAAAFVFLNAGCTDGETVGSYQPLSQLVTPSSPVALPTRPTTVPPSTSYPVTTTVAPLYKNAFQLPAIVQGVQATVVQVGTFAAGDDVELQLGVPSGSGRYTLAFLPRSSTNSYVQQHIPGLLTDVDDDTAIPPPVAVRAQRLAQPGEYDAIVRNVVRFNGTQSNTLTVTSAHALSNPERAILAQQLAVWASTIESTFKLTRPLRLRLEPCGMVNAFYQPESGDVVLCTELYTFFQSNNLRFEGIVYHELGHALLRMWNFPGWDQENDPDDFAIYMAYQTPALTYSIMTDLARYYTSIDPQQDIAGVMQGDQHGTGPQRAAHIEQRFRNPQEWSDNWNRMLYPVMTTAHLQRIVASPQGLESQPIAAATLAGRGEATR